MTPLFLRSSFALAFGFVLSASAISRADVPPPGGDDHKKTVCEEVACPAGEDAGTYPDGGPVPIAPCVACHEEDDGGCAIAGPERTASDVVGVLTVAGAVVGAIAFARRRR